MSYCHLNGSTFLYFHPRVVAVLRARLDAKTWSCLSLEGEASPTPTASPTATPKATATATATPTPTASPSPSPTVSPTPTSTALTLSIPDRAIACGSATTQIPIIVTGAVNLSDFRFTLKYPTARFAECRIVRAPAVQS